MRAARFRWIFLSIGLIVGGLLILRGQLVLGILLAGLAGSRIAAVGLFVRRRRAFGYGTAAGPVPELLRSLVRGDVEAAAKRIGVAPAELRSGLEAGRSIANAAEAAGVPVDAVVDEVIRYAATRIDQLEAEAAVSHDTAARAKQRLPMWTSRFVERRWDARAIAGASN